MSQFLRKTILYRTSNLGLLRNPSVCSLRWFSSSDSDQEQSFTASYLVNSVGLSRKDASSASKYVTFNTREKPDKFIRVFEDYGFTKTQISILVRTRPELLLSNSEKTVLPKLEFFKRKGISVPEMRKVSSSWASIFHTSLDNTIIPSYEFFRKLFNSDEKVIDVVKRCPYLLKSNLEYVEPNIHTLRGLGVPDSNILKLVMNRTSRSLAHRPDQYRQVVEKVAEMGFDVLRFSFLTAVHVLLAIKKSTIQGKVDTYKKWGLSEDQVLTAFRKNPWCLSFSESKIRACMDYFLKEMGLRPSVIMESSTVLSLSLKKRIIPRCSIFQALVSRGLVENKVNLRSLLTSKEEKFLEIYVTRHKKEAPELLALYEKKLSPSNDAERFDKV